MTQKAMAELFDVQRPAITKHLANIFNEKELDKETVCSKMEHTAEDGKKYNTDYYSLDAIISVGYRVNSRRATQFRRWATQVLKKYTIEGYALDKKRMENGAFLDKDYFEKLLEEIREIRLSERRFYQKITDIYMQPASIMMLRLRQQLNFLRKFKIKCTMPSLIKQLQKLSIIEQTIQKKI